MKRFAAILICIFFLGGCGIATRYRIRPTQGGTSESTIEKPSPQLELGERLTYRVEWMGLDVAVATLSVQDIVEQNGHKVYRIVATAHTTPFISKIYKVEDTIITYMDVDGLYPVRFEKKQREGGYRSDEYVDFYQDKRKALYFSRLNHSKKEYDIPEYVQDPLSCIYYFRLQDVTVGSSLYANVNADERNYLLEAKVLRKERLYIKGLGEREAIKVEPLPWFQGKVRRRAKATIWFSADNRRIPLLVVTKGIPFVGSITVTLQSAEYTK